ncbi:hypothetical protein [Streptomyces sp. WG-D5]
MTSTGPKTRRVEVAVVDLAAGTAACDEHLRAEPGADARWLALADVVIGEADDARDELRRLAGACPGAQVVAVPQGARCWVALGSAGGGRVATLVRFLGPPPSSELWALWGSAAHAWVTGGF